MRPYLGCVRVCTRACACAYVCVVLFFVISCGGLADFIYNAVVFLPHMYMKPSVAASVLLSKLLEAMPSAKATLQPHTLKGIFWAHFKVGLGPTAVAEGAVSAEPVAFST